MICQPHRCPAAAARQLCVENAVPAEATASAASTIFAAATPVSSSAYSGVNRAYSSLSAVSNASKVRGRSGRSSSRYVSQFTQRFTKARLYRPVSMRCFAMASRSADSVPGLAGSHRSAFADVFDRRGSITMSFAPRVLPSMIRCACGLK